jgi:hypothetical protein
VLKNLGGFSTRMGPLETGFVLKNPRGFSTSSAAAERLEWDVQMLAERLDRWELARKPYRPDAQTREIRSFGEGASRRMVAVIPSLALRAYVGSAA